MIAIIGLLVALLLPAVQSARETARGMQCGNNLKQVALAAHNYHHSFEVLPAGSIGCCYGTWAVMLLPYVEQTAAYDEHLWTNTTGDPGNYHHQATSKHRFPFYTCPSDRPQVTPAGITYHNYVANYGNTGLRNARVGPMPNYNDVTHFAGAPFTTSGDNGEPQLAYSFATVHDGLSQTLLLSETIQGSAYDKRGFIWWGMATGFMTYLPINSNIPDRIHEDDNPQPNCVASHPDNPPCANTTARFNWTYAARSRHPGGVYAAFCDGAVRYFTDGTADTVWRGMSTTRGDDTAAVSGY